MNLASLVTRQKNDIQRVVEVCEKIAGSRDLNHEPRSVRNLARRSESRFYDGWWGVGLIPNSLSRGLSITYYHDRGTCDIGMPWVGVLGIDVICDFTTIGPEIRPIRILGGPVLPSGKNRGLYRPRFLPDGSTGPPRIRIGLISGPIVVKSQITSIPRTPTHGMPMSHVPRS